MDNQIFDSVDFRIHSFSDLEYESCTFNNCTFSEVNASGILFNDCTFKSCDLSMMNINQTTFNTVRFVDCKMLGLHFESCSKLMFFVEFTNCILNHSCFFQTKLKKNHFKNCSFVEVDFTECDLTQAIFDTCDLSGAIFDHTKLEKADFRTAIHYRLDPEINSIKLALFSSDGISGLLQKYQIEIY